MVDWSKGRSLPGFFNVPIYDIVVFLYLEFRRNALQVRANSVAFSFMLALFPATIVLLSLLPYLPLDGFVDELENNISDIVPNNVLEVIMGFIRDITENTREGLLSLGFILALFFASNGMMALLQGFDKKYEKTVFLSRNFFAQRIVALQLVFLLSITLIFSISLIIGGNILIEYLAEYIKADAFTKGSFFFLRWVAILFLYYGSISVIYRFGPAMKVKFNFLSPGATLATLLCILSSWIFSLYVNSFGTYNQLYGSLGVLIAFMLWLKLNAFILLAGFELNAAIAINRDIRKLNDKKLKKMIREEEKNSE
ncbi:MAG: membrane protein [Maribacter sp.]